MTNRVACLITNYNMPERTDSLVRYIRKHVRTYPVDVVVVDNGSDLVKPSKFTTVKLKKNVQTTAGWRTGLESLDQQYFAYWFLITSTEFIPNQSFDPLMPMVEKLNRDNQAVGVHNALTVDSTTAWSHLKTRGGIGCRQTWMIDNISSLYRADWFDEIGWFDRRFKYAWGVDLETCYLARGQGRTLWVCEDAKVKKVTDIGYSMNRMNMSAEERRTLARDNMRDVMIAKYGEGWHDMMYNEHIEVPSKEQPAWIIGNAPSIARLDMSRLSSEVTFSFNRAYLAYEEWGWYPTYFCMIDAKVMLQITDDINDLIRSGKIKAFYLNADGAEGIIEADNVHLVEFDKTGYENHGGNKWGFVPDNWKYCADVAAFALQVAYCEGYRKIYIAGVDQNWGMHGETAPGADTDHFRPDYEADHVRMSMIYAHGHFNSWRKSIQQATSDPYNMELIITTGESRLRKFLPFVPFENVRTGATDWNCLPDDERPTVSIIVPTYNRPQMLDRALKSIEGQTYQDYEIIIVNDAGTNVLDVAKKYEKTVLIEHTENKGLPATRNTGISMARGKYIAFLDDDDFYFPIHLEVLVRALEEGVDGAYTESYRWDNEQVFNHTLSADFSPERIAAGCPFYVNNVMIKAELFRQFQFDENLPSHEDYDLWLTMSGCGITFRHIELITAIYSRGRGDGQISDRDYHKDYFDIVRKKHGVENKPTAKEITKSKVTISQLKKAKVVSPFVANIDRKSVCFNKDQVVELEQKTADEYIRAGYMMAVDV